MSDKERTPADTLAKILGGVREAAVEVVYGDFTKHMVAHGAHEVAAAIFSGSGFVMYPRGSHDDAQKPEQQPEQQQEQKIEERDRGGRSM